MTSGTTTCIACDHMLYKIPHKVLGHTYFQQDIMHFLSIYVK